MSENLQELAKKYHAFYEVRPYYVLAEEKDENHVTSTRRIQAGFDVDVCGLSDKAPEVAFPPPREYAFGCAEARKIADAVSHHVGDCSIEVISFPTSVFFEALTHYQPEAIVRIRISHRRGVDQPFGLPEQRALEEVEAELKRQGVMRR